MRSVQRSHGTRVLCRNPGCSHTMGRLGRSQSQSYTRCPEAGFWAQYAPTASSLAKRQPAKKILIPMKKLSNISGRATSSRTNNLTGSICFMLALGAMGTKAIAGPLTTILSTTFLNMTISGIYRYQNTSIRMKPTIAGRPMNFLISILKPARCVPQSNLMMWNGPLPLGPSGTLI